MFGHIDRSWGATDVSLLFELIVTFDESEKGTNLI